MRPLATSSPFLKTHPSMTTNLHCSQLNQKFQQRRKEGGRAAWKTEIHGGSPKDSRARIRESLPQGFYICLSGKRSIRTLHRLGSCNALPDIDYLRWTYSGRRYAQACRLGRGMYTVFTSRGCLIGIDKRHGIFLLDT